MLFRSSSTSIKVLCGLLFTALCVTEFKIEYINLQILETVLQHLHSH